MSRQSYSRRSLILPFYYPQGRPFRAIGSALNPPSLRQEPDNESTMNTQRLPACTLGRFGLELCACMDRPYEEVVCGTNQL